MWSVNFMFKILSQIRTWRDYYMNVAPYMKNSYKL